MTKKFPQITKYYAKIALLFCTFSVFLLKFSRVVDCGALPLPPSSPWRTPLQWSLGRENKCLARPLQARLRQLHVRRASCLPPTTPSGRTQCCSSAARLVFRLRRYDQSTTSLTPSRYCTGCVCRNESISSWRRWRTVCWTVWRRRTWINLFRYPALLVVAVYGRLSHCSCSSRHTVCQQSAVARFRSQPLFLNALPDDIQSAPSVSAFRRLLKTFLFQHSFPDVIL